MNIVASSTFFFDSGIFYDLTALYFWGLIAGIFLSPFIIFKMRGRKKRSREIIIKE